MSLCLFRLELNFRGSRSFNDLAFKEGRQGLFKRRFGHPGKDGRNLGRTRLVAQRKGATLTVIVQQAVKWLAVSGRAVPAAPGCLCSE